VTLQDIAIIERIVRQQCCGGPDHPEEVPFEEWLSVDQKQFLELVEHIPGRLSPYPLRDIFAGVEMHACPTPGCPVKLGPGLTTCWEHRAEGVIA
jgi:hypothetical protein